MGWRLRGPPQSRSEDWCWPGGCLPLYQMLCICRAVPSICAQFISLHGMMLYRYASNIIFNIANKNSLTAFPCPWFISTLQLGEPLPVSKPWPAAERRLQLLHNCKSHQRIGCGISHARDSFPLCPAAGRCHFATQPGAALRQMPNPLNFVVARMHAKVAAQPFTWMHLLRSQVHG